MIDRGERVGQTQSALLVLVSWMGVALLVFKREHFSLFSLMFLILQRSPIISTGTLFHLAYVCGAAGGGIYCLLPHQGVSPHSVAEEPACPMKTSNKQ